MGTDDEAFVSAIVPTFNRSAALGVCLASLAAQTYPAGRWEIVVVDDGSTDETGRTIAHFMGRMPLRASRHAERCGSGPARNTGVEAARGDILVFLDSDVVAPPALLAEHARSHAARRCFVNGPAISVRADCDPAALLHARSVRLLAALDFGGACFVTANASCRRSDLVAAGGFDAAFGARYGWEDTEFGIRLQALGVPRVKNRRAYVLHRHVSGYDWRERGRKQEEAGVNAAYFLAKHPTRRVARLVAGRPGLARWLARWGLDGDRLARGCERHPEDSPLAWALREAYALQAYARGLRRGWAASAAPEGPAQAPGREP